VGGTDHALFRLGDDMVVRLPRRASSAVQVPKEWRWLPWLAPQLPLPIPQPLLLGQPAEGYPCPWLVCHWLDGEPAALDKLADSAEAGRSLARFVAALQRIDGRDAPVSPRGGPLQQRDEATRQALAALAGQVDEAAALSVWRAALAAPPWSWPPVWMHGDLLPGNLLAVDGRLTAVIDFGLFGLGDPACDLMPAWAWLDERGRTAFREVLAPDDASWVRGRGWALSFGLIALPYYGPLGHPLAATARHAITQALADER
jgi:aminoglycoside phosphotransferase (APT) family kinase protein